MTETPARYRVRSKYNNRRVAEDGCVFDSLRELCRYRELRLLVAAGEIGDLVVHPVYDLVAPVTLGGRRRPAIRYAADFAYTDKQTGETVVEDVKGVRTAVYALKRHLMMAVHGIEVVEVSA